MQCDLKNQAEHVAGKAKEAAGKLTGKQALELEGKLQAMGSEVSQQGKQLGNKLSQQGSKLSKQSKQFGKELKETLAEKANDLLDELQDKKEQHDKMKED